MATSGTINYTTNDSRMKLRLKWSASQSVSTMKSTISYSIQAYHDRNDFLASKYSGNIMFYDERANEYVATESFSYAKTLSVRTWITIYSGSFTVSHRNSDGTAGDIRIGSTVQNAVEAGYRYAIENNKYIELSSLNRWATVSSAPNFTDEDNPTMKYSVPVKGSTTLLEACISFDGSNPDIPYRDIDKNSTSYTFELTDEEREILRNGTLNGSNTRTVYFYIRSKVSGYTKTKRLAKTLTIINADPELSCFLMDTNEKTVALTGDSLASLIKGYSNVSYEMSANGVKGADIVGYKIENGSFSQSGSSGTIYGVNDNTFKLSATDNRNLTTTKEFTLNMIDYFKPTCSQEAKIEMSGETTAKITIEVGGEWSSKHFGAVHNALRVECRYKVGSGEWSAWEGADYISDNNTYKITYTKDGLLYSSTYTVQSRAVDLLDEAVTAEYALKLIPVFDWSNEDFNFNVPVNFQKGFSMGGEDALPIVDYIVEQGTEAMGTNGTWYWSKWKSGKAECYGIRNYGNMGISTAWGDLYVSPDFNQNLPAGLFAQAPDFISITPQSGGYGTWVSKGYEDTPTESTTGTFCLVRSKSNTLSQVNLSFLVIGRWK